MVLGVVLILLGNFIGSKLFYHTSWLRFIGGLSLVIVLIGIYQVAKYITQVWLKRKLHKRLLSQEEKQLNRFKDRVSLTFCLLLALNIAWFIYLDHSKKNDLSAKGIWMDLVVSEAKWRYINNKQEYWVYYTLHYNGKAYPMHSYNLYALQAGDSIQIQFLPDNPWNHTIVKKAVQGP